MGISRVSFVSTPAHLKKSAKTKSMLWTFEDETEDVPDDNKIRDEVTALRLAIGEHTHNHYTQEPARCTVPELVEVFADNDVELPSYSTTDFAHLLCDIRTRSSAIKSFIAYMVTKKMDFNSSPKDTLLQPSIVECMKDFGLGNPHIKLNEADENLFAHWRMLSAHFISRAQKAEDIVKDNHEDSIEKNVLEIDKILHLFVASGEDNPKRLQDIETIYSKGRDIGKLMFASPSRWRFDWKPSRSTVERDIGKQERHGKRSKEEPQHRSIDSEGRPLILICFPSLEQRFTQNAEDSDGLDKKRRLGEYDAGPDIRRVLKPVRRGTMEPVEERPPMPTESVGDLSTSSKGILPREKSDNE